MLRKVIVILFTLVSGLFVGCSISDATLERVDNPFSSTSVERWSAYRLPKGVTVCLAASDVSPLDRAAALEEGRRVFLPLFSKLKVVPESVSLGELKSRCGEAQFALHMELIGCRADIEGEPIRILDLDELSYTLAMIDLATDNVVEKLSISRSKPFWQFTSATQEELLVPSLNEAANLLVGGGE